MADIFDSGMRLLGLKNARLLGIIIVLVLSTMVLGPMLKFNPAVFSNEGFRWVVGLLGLYVTLLLKKEGI